MTSVARPAGSQKQPIDLFRGWPNPALLPVDSFSHAASAALSTPSVYRPGFQYGPDEGYEPLRRHIAEWLTSFYRPRDPVTAARICISGGASQNLACILQVFTDPAYTRNIWMVAPTYYLACRIFHDAGFMNRTRGVPEDSEGVDIAFLEQELQAAETKALADGNTAPLYTLARPWSKIYKHVIYLTPTFANPSMKVVSLQRREQLVRLARRYDALIVSDDVYDFLQWPSDPSATLDAHREAPVPRLVDTDRYLDGGPADAWGNTVSNGSFSKLLGPGVRTGWAESSDRLSYGLSQAGSSRSGGAPSHLMATFIDQLLSEGVVQTHIASLLQPSYRARYQTVVNAIHEHLIPLGFTMPSVSLPIVGGYFVWIDLPDSLQASTLTDKALVEESLKIGSGTLFQVQGDTAEDRDDFEGSIRICFAWEEFNLLEPGVRRLADVARRMLTGR